MYTIPLLVAQREQVFHKSKEEIKKIAVDGAELLKKLADETEGNSPFRVQPGELHRYRDRIMPLEVCNAVLDVWKPTADTQGDHQPSEQPCSMSMPHVLRKPGRVYERASEIPRERRSFPCILTMTEAAESQTPRWVSWQVPTVIEGTLFGNGERTGNVDIVTLAYEHVFAGRGSGTGLTAICRRSASAYETVHRHEGQMREAPTAERAGICGILRFPPGCDRKGHELPEPRTIRETWTVPYLPIDPNRRRTHLRRRCDPYQQPVRKGRRRLYPGAATYGLKLPKKMREAMGYAAKDAFPIVQHKELHAEGDLPDLQR